jgi:hypothetical protein
VASLGLPTDASDEQVEERMMSEDPGRQDVLGRCDERYYAGGEPIADRLFEWIDRNRGAVRVGAG